MVKRVEEKPRALSRKLLNATWRLGGHIVFALLAVMVFLGGNTVTAMASQPGGVAVSGIVKTYNPGNKTEIQLMRGAAEAGRITIGATAGSGQAEQGFAFEGVAPGTYSLVITKRAHTALTVQNIVVGAEDVDLARHERSDVRVMALRCGDVNENGMIDSGDLAILWQQANYNRNAGEASVNGLCDLNGDGMVNDGDLTILWHVSNYNKGAAAIDLAGSATVRHTVVFKGWDGSILDTQTVAHGSSATPPSPPAQNGYVFTGWDVSYLTVTADTIVTATYAAADGLNFFSVSSASGKPGDIVTATVSIGGIVATCGFDMRLAYDGDVLEYVGHNADWDLDIVANHVPSEREIRFNYCATRNRTASAKLMDVSFRIKPAGAAAGTVSIVPAEIICIDDTGGNGLAHIGVNAMDGSVAVN
jgi:hypothetical protein